MTDELEHGKTFDVNTNEFAPLNYQVDLDELESLRFFDSQINLIASQLSKLAKAVASGLQVHGSNQGLAQLEENNKKIVLSQFKMDYCTSHIENMVERSKKLESELKAKAEMERLKEPIGKMEKIEEVYGKYLQANNRDNYLQLINRLDKLRNRVDALEIYTEKMTSSFLGERLEKVRKQI